MANYNSSHTGQEIDAAVDAALNPDTTPTNGSGALMTSGGVYAAEALLAPKASPTFTGNPTAPTQAAGNNSTRLATTAFVKTAVDAEKTRAQAAESAEVTRAEAAEDDIVANIAPVEATTTASRDYSIGEHFYDTTGLKRVTSTIQQGDTISNSNSRKVSVSKELFEPLELAVPRDPITGEYLINPYSYEARAFRAGSLVFFNIKAGVSYDVPEGGLLFEISLPANYFPIMDYFPFDIYGNDGSFYRGHGYGVMSGSNRIIKICSDENISASSPPINLSGWYATKF